MNRTMIELTLPEGQGDTSAELHEIVAAVALDMRAQFGNDSGVLHGFGGPIEWRVTEDFAGIEIDRRQRVAAALMLLAVDLPQDASSFFAQMLVASRVAPGMTIGDVGDMGQNNRLALLTRADALLQEMMDEEIKAISKAAPE